MPLGANLLPGRGGTETAASPAEPNWRRRRSSRGEEGEAKEEREEERSNPLIPGL